MKRLRRWLCRRYGHRLGAEQSGIFDISYWVKWDGEPQSQRIEEHRELRFRFCDRCGYRKMSEPVSIPARSTDDESLDKSDGVR